MIGSATDQAMSKELRILGRFTLRIQMPSRKTREREDTAAEVGGLFLVVVGGSGTFVLGSGTWGLWDALPRVVGIISCLFLVFVGAVLLVVPEEKRTETLEATLRALVAGLKITLKAIETMAKLILAQVSRWEQNRRTKNRQ